MGKSLVGPEPVEFHKCLHDKVSEDSVTGRVKYFNCKTPYIPTAFNLWLNRPFSPLEGVEVWENLDPDPFLNLPHLVVDSEAQEAAVAEALPDPGHPPPLPVGART